MNTREQEIRKAYVEIRQTNSTIPDDVLDAMRDGAIMLSNLPTPEEIQTMAQEYSPLYKQPLQNIAYRAGANAVVEKIKG